MSRPTPDALWYSALSIDDLHDDTVLDRSLVSGEGCHVTDASGRRYLDARSGLWNTSLGYSNQRIIDAMSRQLTRLPTGQIIREKYPTRIALDYASRLVDALPAHFDHVRFCTTGAQAAEGAVLISRFVRKLNDEPDRTGVLAFHNGYHGTGGIASKLTGEPWQHRWQEPLAPAVHHVDPWDLTALRKVVEQVGPEQLTAMIMEPVLGTDILVAPDGFLAEAQWLCRDTGIHLIIDEVTTGFGRTGAIARTEQLGLQPDMLLLSKGITAGYAPLAAIATTRNIVEQAASRPGVVCPHGSTSDGHPVSMAAGLAVLDELADGKIFDNVAARGDQLRDHLHALARQTGLIGDIRGPGLLIGADLHDRNGQPLAPHAVQQLCRDCRDNGLVLSSSNSTLVLVPPLVITSDECDQLIDILSECLYRLDISGG
jgi:adenosylmethionine-8-amino-7-oxononanoate aminotransferase